MKFSLEGVLAFGAFVFGFAFALMIIALGMHGTLGECRANHPGYDCSIGWVQAEPFK